ncbi:MAG: PEP-CTERM sorting domain-containing protein [Pirellulaceae bacterium]|jgi:hypothetical protein|nr:PEP-CTERM sorting domain-containing protein [Pirellulaceae bacterium]
MVHRPLGWLGIALVVCALLGCLTTGARADIITYTAELPGDFFQLAPGAGATNISLGILGPQYQAGGSGPLVSIPIDRIITGATLFGSWTPPEEAMEYPSSYEMRANGITIPDSVPQAGQTAFAWDFDLPGDLDSLRNTGISISVRLVGQSQLSGIGVGPTRIEITTVPEPGSLVLWSAVGGTCVGALYLRRRRTRA